MDNIIVYNSGAIELNIPIKDETIWATVKDIANIFEKERSVVSRHIKNIFKDGELDEKVVCANFAHTTKHGAWERGNNHSVTILDKLVWVV
ncbi:hypothetical protein MLC52_04925 [Sulfurimonas sp. NW15]|uniref:hypothetical protein n=1 Tax=Sulfurimonas sp. NW15 TaxID=2922729 RepID=UPI003DA9BA7C